MNQRISTIANQISVSGTNILMDTSRLAGFSALLLGAFFVLGVGFAGSEVIHNAAHDTRHSLAFPCH